MKKIPVIIGWFLLVIVFVLYLYGIFYAIFMPDEVLNSQKIIIGYTIPEPLDTLVSTIGAILLTNLGAVLGISVSQPQSGLAGKTLILSKSVKIPDPLTKRELIQIVSVMIYILTLIACFVAWGYSTFGSSEDLKPVVPFVQLYGKTLIGVITAYIAFVLGVNRT